MSLIHYSLTLYLLLLLRWVHNTLMMIGMEWWVLRLLKHWGLVLVRVVNLRWGHIWLSINEVWIVVLLRELLVQTKLVVKWCLLLSLSYILSRVHYRSSIVEERIYLTLGVEISLIEVLHVLWNIISWWLLLLMMMRTTALHICVLLGLLLVHMWVLVGPWLSHMHHMRYVLIYLALISLHLWLERSWVRTIIKCSLVWLCINCLELTTQSQAVSICEWVSYIQRWCLYLISISMRVRVSLKWRSLNCGFKVLSLDLISLHS